MYGVRAVCEGSDTMNFLIVFITRFAATEFYGVFVVQTPLVNHIAQGIIYYYSIVWCFIVSHTYVIQLATKILITIFCCVQLYVYMFESIGIANGFPLISCKIKPSKAKSIRISLKITQHAARIDQSVEEIPFPMSIGAVVYL